LKIQIGKHYKKKIKGHINDKDIRVNPHYIRFKVLSVNGIMANVELPNKTTLYMKVEDFEEDFDFPLKFKISKATGNAYPFKPKRKSNRSIE
jgi:hypothetical protein